VEIVEIGKNIGGGRGVACIESTALIEAPKGAGPGEVSRWGLGCPLSPQHNSTAPDFQDLVDVFLVGTARRPIQLQSANGLWTVVIAWFTPSKVVFCPGREARGT